MYLLCRSSSYANVFSERRTTTRFVLELCDFVCANNFAVVTLLARLLAASTHHTYNQAATTTTPTPVVVQILHDIITVRFLRHTVLVRNFTRHSLFMIKFTLYLRACYLIST